MKVEIGPGEERREGWVGVSCVPGASVDLLAEWGLDPLPFIDGSVVEIYASHVIEHVPWFRVDAALLDAWRVLRPGGTIEIHTLDAKKIVSDALANCYSEKLSFGASPWHDSFTAAMARIINYPRNANDRGDANWHRSAHHPAALANAIERAGFRDLEWCRDKGSPHGRYSFWVRGVKR